MKIRNWKSKNMLIALVLLVSVATAIYVSAASQGLGNPKVTVVDMGNPDTVRDALTFDPFQPGSTPVSPNFEASDAAMAAEAGPDADSQGTAADQQASLAKDASDAAQLAPEEVASAQPFDEELAAADAPPAGAPAGATTGAKVTKWTKLVQFVQTPLGMAVTAVGVAGVTVGTVAIVNANESSDRSPS